MPQEIGRLVVFSLSLACLGNASAQGDTDTIHRIEGASMAGRVQSIDAKGAIAFVGSDGKPAALNLNSVRSVQFGKINFAPIPRQGMVLFRSGVELPATIRKCNGRSLGISSPLIEGEATFSLARVQAIRFAKLPADQEGGFQKYLREPKEEMDLLYFKSGDRVVQQSITVEGFEEGSLVYEARGKSRSRKIDRIYGLIMAKNSGFRADPLPRPRVVIQMQGGSTLRGRLDGLDESSCKIFTEEHVNLNVNRSRVTGLVVESDRLVFLADLKPAKVMQTSALRSKKPWMINRSPMGSGIHIGGVNPRKADNGLVLIPRTGLTYEIGGRFDFFEATICIDARSTGPAHAVFRIKDGNKVLYESEPITRQSEPLAIKVTVTKVMQLTIEADFGKNFDFGDHCVFAEARVIRQGS